MREYKILFFDLETAVNQKSIQYMPEPTAPSNYKDETKIAEYVESKKMELIEKAPLDPDFGRIIALGYATGDSEPVSIITAETDEEEFELITKFWELLAQCNGRACGYNILNFDFPYVLRRSMGLGGVKPRMIPNLNKYQKYPITDLMNLLYNYQPAKGLKTVCKRYGIPNPLPDVDGSQVSSMSMEDVARYCKNDVEMTQALYRLMKGIYFEEEEEEWSRCICPTKTG